MKTIDMGMNATPPKGQEEFEIIKERFIANCGEVPNWLYQEQQKAEILKQTIIDVVEAEGGAELSWGCDGETRFNIHARQWEQALPQYRFEIARYSCIAYKK